MCKYGQTKILGLYTFEIPFLSKTPQKSAFTDVHIQMIKKSKLPSPTESRSFLSDSGSTKNPSFSLMLRVINTELQ